MRNVLLICFKHKYYKSIWKVQNSFIENIKCYGPNLQSLDFLILNYFLCYMYCLRVYICTSHVCWNLQKLRMSQIPGTAVKGICKPPCGCLSNPNHLWESVLTTEQPLHPTTTPPLIIFKENNFNVIVILGTWQNFCIFLNVW